MFSSKAVLITGGARGIGRAIAEAFLHERAMVAICDIRPEGAEVAKQLGALFIYADIAQPYHRERIIEQTLKQWGALHILVNNAAVAAPGSAMRVAPQDWHNTLEVNLTAPMHLSALAAKEMVKTGGGAIVNVASVQGLLAEQNNAAYTASKGGLAGTRLGPP